MKTLLKFSLSVLPVLMFASCADSPSSLNSSSSGGSGVINQNEVIEPDGSNVQGHYAAEIWPMNHNLHFKSIGTVGVTREGDSFTARIRFKYGPKDTVVKAAIYNARRCPNINDDINKDAYIDIMESRLVTGKMLIPLDGDLDSQSAGRYEYPRVDANGKVFYSKSASFSRMFEDLKNGMGGDDYMKLKEDEGFTLPGRIVMFQGMSKKVNLPDSVRTTGGESKYETIPIGCAVLWKVDELPDDLKEATATSIMP